MSWASMKNVKVKLVRDLTSYHPELKVGIEGVTNFESAMWGYWVYFPIAGKWDIIHDSLEVIDKDYLEDKAKWDQEQKDKQEKIWKKHKKIVLQQAKTGGRRLLYTTNETPPYIDSESNSGRIDLMLEFYKKNHMSVKLVNVKSTKAPYQKTDIVGVLGM